MATANLELGDLLIKAAAKGDGGRVGEMLAAGAAVDTCDKDGRTALHLASRNSHAPVVAQLLAAGAAVDASDKYGWTALHRAASRGRADVVAQLLEAGAKLDATQVDGANPLHIASWRGHAAVAAQLLEVGANPQSRSFDGKVPEELTDDAEVKAVFAAWRARKAAGEALAVMGRGSAPGGCHGRAADGQDRA